MLIHQRDLWVDQHGRLRGSAAPERWSIDDALAGIVLPVAFASLTGELPRWYGWVIIGVLAGCLLLYVAGRLRAAGAVIDAMPLDPRPPAGEAPRPSDSGGRRLRDD